MTDSFSEKIGFGKRIQNSFKGVLVGAVLIILSGGFLWWNEGRTIKEHRAITEVGEKATTVDSQNIDPSNDNTIIHIGGTVSTKTGVSDSEFKLQTDALALNRIVEMYQWTETTSSNSNNDTKTYNYKKSWENEAINSSNFRKKEGHQNPPMNVLGKVTFAQDARLDAFMISPSQVGRINAYEAFNVQASDVSAFPTELSSGSISGNFVYSGNPSDPAVGDYRVSFMVIPNNTDATLVGQQYRQGIKPYIASNGRKIEIVYPDILPLDLAISKAQDDNAFIGWIIRAAGLIFMMIGFSMLLGPIQAMASIVPFLGGLVNNINSFIGGVLGFSVGITIIAISWITYRPLIGIPLLLIAIGTTVYVSRKKEAPQTPPSA